MTKLVKLDSKLEPPVIPQEWDYDKSVKKVKQVIYKWKNLTDELAQELYVARKILSLKPEDQPRSAVGTFVPTDKNWDTYCKDIGSSRQVINRWLARWFGKIPQSQITPKLPEDQYSVIYADPPWQYDNTGITGAAEKHYPTLEIEKICNLQIPSADNAVLFLWVTNPFLKEGIQVCEAWGFEYKTNIVWIKERAGQGFYVKGQHELLFIAVKGNFRPNDCLYIKSVVFEAKGEHSQKPRKFYEIIETLYPNQKYLELFARSKRDGWEAWGKEV